MRDKERLKTDINKYRKWKEKDNTARRMEKKKGRRRLGTYIKDRKEGA